MEFENAQKAVDKRVYEREKRHLSDVENFVLQGVWNGLSYEEMHNESPYSLNYLIRTVGPALWKTLSDTFGEKVNKSNLRAVIQRALDEGENHRFSLVPQELFEPFWPGITWKLHQNEIEKALKIALNAAHSQARELVSLNEIDYDWVKVFLGRGIALEELQKGSEKPDVAVLAIAFEQARETTPCMKSVEPEQLERWLRIFVETYFEQTNTFIRYRAKLREYLERLKTSCEDVKFVGIDVSAREDHRAARLLDIFVVPNVSEEATTSAPSLEQLLLERPKQLTERQAELWLEQRDRHSQERGRSMSAHKMLGSTRRRIVLLGDPGTGKTTLMRYLAVRAAGTEVADIGLPQDQERLPILVYMRDWAKHPELSLLDQVRDFAKNTLQVDLPPGFLEHWMDGQALLLLDGLDEVAEDATRAALVEKINCFLTAHENNWAVITSRPWGYRRDYFRTDAYPHFELELFSESQIQEFIEHWYENRCDNAAQAQEMIRDLQDALKRKDPLQDLVKNPLLLTMVVLMHRYQDTLPKRRYKLYDRAVDTLLKSWDRKGKGETYGEFKHLDRDDDLRRVMSQLAYWIHVQYETQTTESDTVIEEEELLTQLSRIIREEYSQVKPHQAKEEAERFMTFIRDRAGLLNEYERGRYAFVHKTFQEYLTAEAILNQAEYEDNSELIYEAIQTHLHNSHWREVILLLVSQLQGKKAAKAIEVILRHNSPYEQWLHRDLLFAGRCLTEDPEKLATAAPETIEEILQRLVKLETVDKDQTGGLIEKEIFESLSWLQETVFNAEALKYLKASKEKIDRWKFLKFQWALGEKNIALASLLDLLRNKNLAVRSAAALVLGNLNDRSEIVLKGLIELLKDESSLVNCFAISALGKLGNHSEIVSKELLALLKDKNSSTRLGAAKVLGKSGNHSEIILKELLNLLKDEDSSVRFSTAETLVKLNDHSEATINVLLQLLQDPDSDSVVLSDTAMALGKLGNCSEIILKELFALLKDKNSSVRSSAASALGNLDNRSELVISELLALLKDKNSSVRSSAASALGNLDNRSELVISELLALLKDENSSVRSSAASALGNLGNRSELVISELLALLKDENSSVRSSAASALGNLDNRSELVISELLALLKDENSSVRSSTANTLAKLGKSAPKVQAGLAKWIEQHSDLPNLGAAIDALWQICA
jgi:HEAT repeat protein